MIGQPFDLDARMALDARMDHVIRTTVAVYRLQLQRILGTDIASPFPLYYPGRPAYDAAEAVLGGER